MNKFQKIAYQIAKDDGKKDLYKGQDIVKRSRRAYVGFNRERDYWVFEKCMDYKNWNKHNSW